MANSDSGQKANNFNLIRLILASLVLVSHSFEMIDGTRVREPLTQLFHTISFGELAVDGFFFLSGFLIVGSYVARPSVSRFLRHRILRIFPAFIACACACAFLVAPLGSASGYLQHLDGWAFLRGLPVLDLKGLPPTFQTLPVPAVNGALWTLQPEFTCYLIALAAGVLGALRRPLAWVLLGILFLVLYELHASHTVLQIMGKPHDFYRPLYRLGIFFVTGGCFTLYREQIRFTRPGALLCAALLMASLSQPLVAEPALAGFGGYLLLWLAFQRQTLFEYARQIPDISYGTYLYGWPIQQLLISKAAITDPWLLFALALPLAWIAGATSWYLIEKPALHLKDFASLHRARVR